MEKRLWYIIVIDSHAFRLKGWKKATFVCNLYCFSFSQSLHKEIRKYDVVYKIWFFYAIIESCAIENYIPANKSFKRTEKLIFLHFRLNKMLVLILKRDFKDSNKSN